MQQAPAAQWIAFARRLDLDHLGAEIAERLAGKRPGDELAEFDDLQALQRAGLCLSGHEARNVAPARALAQPRQTAVRASR